MRSVSRCEQHSSVKARSATAQCQSLQRRWRCASQPRVPMRLRVLQQQLQSQLQPLSQGTMM